MISTKLFGVVTIALAALLSIGSAEAAVVELTFTGTGIHGSTASGSFMVDDASIPPGYFGIDMTFPSLIVTISGIPGGGPTTVSFNGVELSHTWIQVDAAGVAYIAPYGGHVYGPPDYHHYDLGQPSQNHLPSLTFETELRFDGSVKDVITWTPATPVHAPESASGALLLVGIGIIGGAFALRRLSPATAPR